MSAAVKFDAILTAAFDGNPPKRAENPLVEELFRLAWKLDELNARMKSDAESMAKRFASFAERVPERALFGEDPPTGWSTLRDLDRDAATYRAALESFESLFFPATGKTLGSVLESLEARAEAAAKLEAAEKPLEVGERVVATTRRGQKVLGRISALAPDGCVEVVRDDPSPSGRVLVVVASNCRRVAAEVAS